MRSWRIQMIEKYLLALECGVLFAEVLGLLIGYWNWGMCLVVIINAMLLRVLDDCFDYDIDRRNEVHHLPREFFQILAALLIAGYIGLSLASMDWRGLLAIPLVLYMLIANRHEFLKIFLAALTSLYYLWSYGGRLDLQSLIFIVLLVIISATYWAYQQQQNGYWETNGEGKMVRRSAIYKKRQARKKKQVAKKSTSKPIAPAKNMKSSIASAKTIKATSKSTNVKKSQTKTARKSTHK